ncbi:unnamed protein product [Medioppia subpectinata]|uniref:Uncharacterized protein n=1 Tax=Medioppia subpectinata TaxID=1979941 RepID=A0A7R9Q4Z4_9ACAR|nr:unnamed protein product [Medioppia subpectinata]CAG2112215.1 unnamed protein product [Medioppia subpectinata]
MSSAGSCALKASSDLQTIATKCMSGSASNALSMICKSDSRKQIDNETTINGTETEPITLLECICNAGYIVLSRCFSAEFSKLTDQSSKQAIKTSIAEIKTCLQNINTDSSSNIEYEIPELSDRSMGLKKMKNSKASKDVKWDKLHKKLRKGSKLHKAKGGQGDGHQHSGTGKHGTGKHPGHAGGMGMGGLMGTNPMGAPVMSPMLSNAPSGTVIDIGLDENGNFIPVGVSGSNVGGVVVKDPSGNTMPWNEFTNNNKPVVGVSGIPAAPVMDSGYGNGVYDMTGNDVVAKPAVMADKTPDDELDESMDEYGRLMRKGPHGRLF